MLCLGSSYEERRWWGPKMWYQSVAVFSSALPVSGEGRERREASVRYSWVDARAIRQLRRPCRRKETECTQAQKRIAIR